jgi:hypothetical protein
LNGRCNDDVGMGQSRDVESIDPGNLVVDRPVTVRTYFETLGAFLTGVLGQIA